MLGVGLDLWTRSIPGLWTENPYSGYALALDFDDADYWVSGTNYATLSSVPGYAYTRTGDKGEVNASGGIDSFAANVPGVVPGVGYWSRQSLTNLLLNAGQSSNLATQDVAVSAVAHTLSFIGTGSITLSGAHVATLNGTGANDRVVLVFTPSAGTLTLTVTGTVQYSGLMAGDLPDGGPVIATTTAAVTVGEDLLNTNIKSDGTALADADMLIFARGTPKTVGASQYLLELYDTTANRIILYLSGATLQGTVISASALAYDQSVAGAIAADAEVVGLIRRLSGEWRVGKYVGGVLTWGTAAAGAFPVGAAKASPGNSGAGGGGAPLRGPLRGAFIKSGTFATDAEVIAAINETA